MHHQTHTPTLNFKALSVAVQHFINNRTASIIQTSNLQHHYQYQSSYQPAKSLQIGLKVKMAKQWTFCWSIAIHESKYADKINKIHQVVEQANKSNQFLNYKICLDTVKKQLMGLFILDSEILMNLRFEQFSNFIKKELEAKEQELIKFYLKLGKANKENPKKYLKIYRDKINAAKIFIDTEIREREKNTLPSFVNYTINSTVPNPTIKQINNEQPPSIYHELQQICQIKRKIGQKPAYNILEKIKILKSQMDSSWIEPSSNLSVLKKYYIKYLKQTTIHEKVNLFLNQESLSMVFEEKFVVEKKIKNLYKEAAIQSFNNEASLLKYMRNKYEPTIAQYFMDQVNDRLFIKFYPKNGCEHNFRELESINFAKKLGRALWFLQDNLIVHRDLKPNNIMLTNDRSPKIIDFGSAFLKIGSSHSFKIAKKLRTTIHYNLTYNNLSFRNMFDQSEFEEHQYFDMYAFGMIVKDLITNDLPMRAKKDLDWICQRATDRNPYNRIDGKQTVLYCSLLEKEWRIEKKLQN